MQECENCRVVCNVALCVNCRTALRRIILLETWDDMPIEDRGETMDQYLDRWVRCERN